ncbi:hypothetical protein [Deinococcus sp. S9]|uniref:hypothetical protein n=1 Tax=Deinococcus sp. S9 TaxID=2545754 RepID=UPI001055E084|nr:hypothetical protein [Deinococcus sp. S9]TDE85308.1 hypothetical protein E0686_12290 [Deinococcus sp. S9]
MGQRRKRKHERQAALRDVRREYLLSREQRGRQLTTPRELLALALNDQTGWYLHELGLTRNCWQTCPARGELPSIIHTRESPVLELATVG